MCLIQDVLEGEKLFPVNSNSAKSGGRSEEQESPNISDIMSVEIEEESIGLLSDGGSNSNPPPPPPDPQDMSSDDVDSEQCKKIKSIALFLVSFFSFICFLIFPMISERASVFFTGSSRADGHLLSFRGRIG